MNPSFWELSSNPRVRAYIIYALDLLSLEFSCLFLFVRLGLLLCSGPSAKKQGEEVSDNDEDEEGGICWLRLMHGTCYHHTFLLSLPPSFHPLKKYVNRVFMYFLCTAHLLNFTSSPIPSWLSVSIFTESICQVRFAPVLSSIFSVPFRNVFFLSKLAGLLTC